MMRLLIGMDLCAKDMQTMLLPECWAHVLGHSWRDAVGNLE